MSPFKLHLFGSTETRAPQTSASTVTRPEVPTAMEIEPPKASSPRVPSGKLGMILSRISTASGATIEELAEETGWQAPDRSLLRLLGQAHRFREMLLRGDGSTMAELAEEAGVTPSWFSRIVRLGFLSPRIVTAIVDGTQPLELSADRLLKAGPVSSAWSEQLATYGFV